MKITLRCHQDNNEMTFDAADNATIVRWLNGQIGYVASITSNPAQDDICIPVAAQQPVYNPRLHSGGLNPFLAYNFTTSAYEMVGVGPGVEYVSLHNRALPTHERQLLETKMMADWRIY